MTEDRSRRLAGCPWLRRSVRGVTASLTALAICAAAPGGSLLASAAAVDFTGNWDYEYNLAPGAGNYEFAIKDTAGVLTGEWIEPRANRAVLATLSGHASGSSVTIIATWGEYGPGQIWKLKGALDKRDGKIRGEYTINGGTPGTFTMTPLGKPKCIVPGVKGRTLTAARAALSRSHCKLGKVTRAKSRSVAKGKIISASPGAGQTRAAEARINLVVSRGK